MNDPINQHYVPACYLSAFVDPNSPPKKPYVWVFSKDGKSKRHQKSEKVFRKKHLYTIKVKGKKDYSIETSLSKIEGMYADVYKNKIIDKKPLSEYEHVILCAFVSLMLQRTLRYKAIIERFIDELISHAVAIEENNNYVKKTSEDLKKYKINAHKDAMISTFPDITALLFEMNLAFLCAKNSKSGFITSDDPCNLFNPKLQWQKFMSPGLKQKDIELTIALSPSIKACFTWSNLRGYSGVTSKQVEESNRMTRAQCHKEFIVNNPKLKRRWFLKFPLDVVFIGRIIINKIKILLTNRKYKHARRRKIK